MFESLFIVLRWVLSIFILSVVRHASNEENLRQVVADHARYFFAVWRFYETASWLALGGAPSLDVYMRNVISILMIEWYHGGQAVFVARQ